MAALSKAKPARTAPRWSFQERQAIEGDRPATVTRRLAALVAPGPGRRPRAGRGRPPRAPAQSQKGPEPAYSAQMPVTPL